MKTNNNNVVQKIKKLNNQGSLRKNEGTQLSNLYKTKFGYNINDSVIDVAQNEYCISYKDDILYTYGLDTCCGIVICDDNVRMLFHVDNFITPEDVTSITDKIIVSLNAKVIIVPGATCGIPKSFDYKQLEEYYTKKGYEVIKQRITGTFGFVAVNTDNVTIGTKLNSEYDIAFPIPKKVSEYSPESDILEELKKLRQELLKQDLNNNNNFKK